MDWSILLKHTSSLVWLAISILSLIILALYYGLNHRRVGKAKLKAMNTPTLADNLPSASIVMVVHNDDELLKDCLPYLLEQSHPNFEIVIVDYMSNKETSMVLEMCQKLYPDRLRLRHFAADLNMFKGRKYPLSIGIKAAQNDIIVLTETSCIPDSFEWLNAMVEPFKNANINISLGAATMKQGKGLLSTLQQYDHLDEQASWLANALKGKPYSASSRSLAFRRSFFFDSGSFIRHYSEPYGADDMFVNQNATATNTSTVLNGDSSISFKPEPDNEQWRHARFSRYSTKRYYSASRKLRLSLHPLALVIFYLSAGMLCCQPLFCFAAIGLIIIKIAWQTSCFYTLAKSFNAKKTAWWATLLEIYFLFANTFLYIKTLRKKNKQWI